MRPQIALLTAILIFASVVGPVSAAESDTAPSEVTIQCEFPFTATDATGTEVTVESEPQRIVTLSPSAAQTVWEIGGEDKVVGLTQYAAYLDGAETRTNVSGAGQSFVNVERVVSLDPDIVLAPSTIPEETVEKLRETGLTVYRFQSQSSIDDIERKTLLTGQLTGECEGATETAEWMQAELETVQRVTENVERPRVLYVFFGYTAGSDTFADAVIELAGGDNVAADAGISGYEQISQEVVVESNPEWIVVNDGATQIPETRAYQNTHAVQHDQTVVLREPYISQPAPRIVRSVVKLTKALHPEAYREATSTSTAATTETPAEPTDVGETTSTAEAANSTDETDASQTPAGATTETTAPGFGALVALVSLTMVALLARRR
ncbi:MAG: PGF-CTERM-anchored ABC transporter substrate-binding protein [Halobacteriota archaeon]